MRSDKRDLHLTHEDMGVVARVDDEGSPLVIAGKIAVGLKQLRRVTPLIKVRCSRRSGPVERFEIGTGTSQIREEFRFSMRRQTWQPVSDACVGLVCPERIGVILSDYAVKPTRTSAAANHDGQPRCSGAPRSPPRRSAARGRAGPGSPR